MFLFIKSWFTTFMYKAPALGVEFTDSKRSECYYGSTNETVILEANGPELTIQTDKHGYCYVEDLGVVTYLIYG